jgi:ribose-phosphate pyrophosphokinase
MANNFKLFSLRESREITQRIADNLGVKVGKMKTIEFSDGELSTQYGESIRGNVIYIVASLHESHANIFELLLSIDAAKRAGAEKVHLIVPYLAYSRQDRKDGERGACGSRVIINAIESTMGFDSILLLDLHAAQSESSFMKPVIHINGHCVFLPIIRKIISPATYEEWMVYSPDAGGVPRAKLFSDRLNIPLGAINKHRDKPNSIEKMELMGNVAGKRVLLVDDMVDTAGSLVRAVNLLLDNGALEVRACITHGVLSGTAYHNISQSRITKLYISDSIPLGDFKEHRDASGALHLFGLPPQIEVVSSAAAIASVIDAMDKSESISWTLDNLDSTIL